MVLGEHKLLVIFAKHYPYLRFMKLDILAFAAHPDDVELSCAGTILKHVAAGNKVGIVDLTRGELGTRGTPELRLQEAAKAAEILGLSARENLGMADGFFEVNKDNQLALIRMLRKYRPEIVLANAVHDRHIDHGRASRLASEACFLSGLRKIETELEGHPQEAWRPKAVYHYIQDRFIKPDFVVDITPFIDKKMEAMMAFASQFNHVPGSNEPQTPISSPEFVEFIKSRAANFGRDIGAQYGEGYTVERTPGVNSFFDLL